MIKKFSEYLSEEKVGVYAAAILTDESKTQLYEFVNDNLNLDKKIDKQDYHTTVAYSRKHVNVKLEPQDIKVSGTPLGYELFDTQDGGKCLVLKIESDDLTELHNTFKELGASYDYDEYKPHITLCYDFKGKLEDLPLPEFDVKYNLLEVKPLDVDYRPEDK